MTLNQNARRLQGRIGGLTTRSLHDPLEYTAAARKRFRDSFATLVDPDGVLTPEERATRAHAARQAHMARLALLSAQSRARRRRLSRIEPRTRGTLDSARAEAPHLAGTPEDMGPTPGDAPRTAPGATSDDRG